MFTIIKTGPFWVAVVLLASGPLQDTPKTTAAAQNTTKAAPLDKKAGLRLLDGVSAAELVRVYRTNAAAADERFSHKPTRVVGRLLRVRSEGELYFTQTGKTEVRYDLEMAGGE